MEWGLNKRKFYLLVTKRFLLDKIGSILKYLQFKLNTKKSKKFRFIGNINKNNNNDETC
jgi:hypothetical protein